MKRNVKYLSLIPLVALTSCGYGLEELYHGNAYNSPVFQENYYREWDSDLKNKITSSSETPLQYDKDKVFLSYYGDEHFHSLEKDRADSNDDILSGRLTYDGVDASQANYYYGPNKCLSNIDDSFSYGYASKLFDGQMFCNHQFQLARVQIDGQGFGKLFEKECSSAKYFAMNFKASSDYTHEDNPATSPHRSEVKLKIGFYIANDRGYEESIYTYNLQDIENDLTTRSVPTNTSDNRSEKNPDYLFFGFELGNNIDIKRCRGISVSFDLLKDSDKENKGLDYALMIYEILLPDSTWN